MSLVRMFDSFLKMVCTVGMVDEWCCSLIASSLPPSSSLVSVFVTRIRGIVGLLMTHDKTQG